MGIDQCFPDFRGGEDVARRMLFILANAGEAGTGALASALAQASVAAAMEVAVDVAFTGDAAGVLQEQQRQALLPDGSGRTVATALTQARELGVRLLLCSPALARFGPELEREVDEVVGAAWLVTESLRDDTVVLTF